jgi:hypothetical protein
LCLIDEDTDFFYQTGNIYDFMRDKYSSKNNDDAHLGVWHGITSIEEVDDKTIKKINKLKKTFHCDEKDLSANNNVQMSDEFKEQLKEFEDSTISLNSSNPLIQLAIFVPSCSLFSVLNYAFSGNLYDNFIVSDIRLNGLSKSYEKIFNRFQNSFNKCQSKSTFRRDRAKFKFSYYSVYILVHKELAKKYLNYNNKWEISFDQFVTSGMLAYTGKGMYLDMYIKLSLFHFN